MPYHDLNLTYTSDTRSLNYTIAFAEELGYGTIALTTTITGKLPSAPPVLNLEPLQKAHPNVTLLSRLTLPISDPSQNHRLSQFSAAFSLLALRPQNEKALQLACTSLDCDLISLDLSARLPFILKFKTLSAALQRGIRFEIAYSPSLSGGSDAKRNLIAGATSLIRATRARGIVISSEARNALGLRGPHDVMNLCQVWGLEQAKGKEAVCEEAAKVVRLATLRRQSYRGVITVIDGGGRPPQRPVGTEAAKLPIQADIAATVQVAVEHPATATAASNGVKRKASTSSPAQHQAEAAYTPASTAAASSAAADENGTPLSKREQKRRAKKARLEGSGSNGDNGRGSQSHSERQPKAKDSAADGNFSIRHETSGGTGAKQKQQKRNSVKS